MNQNENNLGILYISFLMITFYPFISKDTHNRIRAYNLDEDQTDHTVLQESHGIMSFTLDDSDRYALLNIANQVNYSICHLKE